MPDQRLIDIISAELREGEDRGDIVIVSPSPSELAGRIAEKIREITPSPDLAHRDLVLLRGLVVHLTCGVRYCEEDLPAATGGTLDDFREIALKLPLE